MSTSGATASRSQRSTSTSRSSRRATMTIGPGVGSLLSSGSLSPQRAVRARVLREKETNNDSSSRNTINSTSDAAGTKAKPVTNVATKGSTRTQHMQYAFGSKVMKPAGTRTGMGAAAAGDIRGRTQAAVSDASGSALARPRRDRSARNEAHEQRGASRGRAATSLTHPLPPAVTREETDAAHILKAQLEEKEATIANLKSKLERNTNEGTEGVAGDENAQAATPKATRQGGDTHGSKQRELDAGAQASLRLMQEESRAEVEEALIRVEAVAAAGLSRTEKMQTSVNEMIRTLKARQ